MKAFRFPPFYAIETEIELNSAKSSAISSPVILRLIVLVIIEVASVLTDLSKKQVKTVLSIV